MMYINYNSVHCFDRNMGPNLTARAIKELRVGETDFYLHFFDRCGARDSVSIARLLYILTGPPKSTLNTGFWAKSVCDHQGLTSHLHTYVA